jgi:AcrR family transcriptional regulator
MARAGLSPQRVVAEAATVADEVGLHQLTLATVAERFGVSLPSLYKHVNGLDGLRRDLAVMAMRELGAALTAAAVGRSGKDALESVAHSYRAFAKHRPGLYEAALRAPSPDDDEHIAVSRDALGVMIAVARSYGIEGEDAIHAIRFMRSAAHGFISQEAAGSFGRAYATGRSEQLLPQSIDHSYHLLIEALHLALTSWSTLG